MAKQTANRETIVDLQFPLQGIDETRGFARQRPGTTVDAQNVRAFEQMTGRARGGQRPGLVKYFPGTANGTFPIQDIDHLVSTTVAPPLAFGKFSYGMPVNTGFGIGNGTTGSSFVSGLGAVTGFAFACSCWDDSGNLYVVEVNVTTGSATLYQVIPAGTVGWTFAFSVAAGSLRNVAGMVFIGTSIYLARTVTVGTSYQIIQINAAAGTLTSGTWQVLAAGIIFSAQANNVLGKIGATLGVLEMSATVAIFKTFNALAAPGAAALTTTNLVGTRSSAQHDKVVSDGQSNFYVLGGITTQQVAKISLGGVIVWQSAAADTANSITYDTTTNQLVALSTTVPGVRSLNLATGLILAAPATPGGFIWSNIDCDGQGNFTLWRNSVASNDVVGLSPTLGTVWGPSTLANAVHFGTSVNKGAPAVVAAVLGTRVIRGILVSGGTAMQFASTGTTAITNGASFAPSVPVVFSAQNGFNMFFVDGVSYRYYNPFTNTINLWTATSGGAIPTDPNTSPCRLICLWRGRIVIAGLLGNPQQLFMSAVNDPFNWNFTPNTSNGTQAFATTRSTLTGLPGDLINGIIPYNDDTLLILCDHSIYQLTGDPAAGGQFDLVSDTLGGAWGRAWCKDPVGQIYFFGSKCGIFKMTPGGLPVRVSQQIEKRLESIDLSANLVRMAWDLQAQGMYVFITPLVATQATRSFFFDERVQAWFCDVFPAAMNPLAIEVYDGDGPTDRVILLGGKDGSVRAITATANNDDGTAIASYVLIGPIGTKNFDSVLLKDLQATLDSSAATITYSVYIGQSAQLAFASAPVVSGTWVAGRNPVSFVRRNGIAIYVKLSATSFWALEYIRARYAPLGKVLARMP